MSCTDSCYPRTNGTGRVQSCGLPDELQIAAIKRRTRSARNSTLPSETVGVRKSRSGSAGYNQVFSRSEFAFL